VYEIGDPPDYWYGILRGEFVMQKRMNHNSSGKVLTHSTTKFKLLATGIIEPGQCFGEEEMFMATPRKASVVCQSNDNQVVKIPTEQFVLVIGQYPRKISDLANSVAMKK